MGFFGFMWDCFEKIAKAISLSANFLEISAVEARRFSIHDPWNKKGPHRLELLSSKLS
jgi:hypothetical protein